MLEQVLTHLNNWFLVPDGIHEDTYTIKNGGITLSFLQNGQFFRICGSVFNDGLYLYDAEMMNELKDETFTGEIWALAIPKAVISLSNDIDNWEQKNGDAAASAFQSESYAGYSYTKATDAQTGCAVTWQSAFRSRLNQWRKL